MLSKFKKKLRTNEAENWQKIKNISLNSKFTGSKKRVYLDAFTFEKRYIAVKM